MFHVNSLPLHLYSERKQALSSTNYRLENKRAKIIIIKERVRPNAQTFLWLIKVWGEPCWRIEMFLTFYMK